MQTTNTTRRAVAILANALRYQQGFTPSAAWLKAWKVVKLKAQLSEGFANFTYTKKDGTHRPATGTTSPALTGYTPKADAPRRNYSPLYVRYFDAAARDFRQFAAARLQ
ncbi:MAG: SH3 beta-barrel fold-containing protein [Saprospiraceae bacterium]